MPPRQHMECYSQTSSVAPELGLWGAGLRVGKLITCRKRGRDELDLFPLGSGGCFVMAKISGSQ